MNRFQEGPVNIRRATIDDARDIARISREGWLTTYTNEALGITKERILKQLGTLEDNEAKLRTALLHQDWVSSGIFVAEQDKKVVGFVRPRPDDQKRHRVGALYVDNSYRGIGVGSRLIHQVKDFFREHAIYLEVASYNLPAKDFYLSHGFTFTGKKSAHHVGSDEHAFSIPVEEMVFDTKTTGE